MLSHLMISHRIMIGLGILLSITMGMAVVAERRVHSIETSLTTVNEVNSVKQRHAINFRGSVHDRAIAVRDVTLVDRPELDAILAKIDSLTQAYTASAGPLDDLMKTGKGVTPSEVTILASIKATEAETMPLVGEVIRLQRDGQTGAAHALLMSRARPAFVEWLARINQFINLEEEKSRVEGTNARDLANGFIWLTLWLCAGALASAAGIAYWLIIAISRPLAAMTKTLTVLAAGDRGAAIPGIDRRDEIGAMAMAAQIFKDAAIESDGLRAAQKDVGQKVDSAAKRMSSESKQLSSNAEVLSQGVAKQASAAEQVSAAMEEMGGSVKQNASNAAQTEMLGFDDFDLGLQSMASRAANDFC